MTTEPTTPNPKNHDARPSDEVLRRQIAALSETNEQLRLFQLFSEASGIGFGMADLNGIITYWNPALCRMFGEDDPNNAVGKHVTEYYPEEYWEKRQKEIVPAVIRDGHWFGELAIHSRNGQIIPILQNAFLIRDENGQPLQLAAAITDITDRKRAEEAIRQSHEELRAIYDGEVDGILIADCETRRFVRTNPAMCGMLRCCESELLSLSVADIHPPEHVAAVQAAFQELAEGHGRLAAGTPVLRRDGTVFYADITTNRLEYRGRPCLIGFFRDITERHQAQQALEREHRTLTRMLEASDHERQVITYELHDGLAQYLAAAIMQFDVSAQLRAKNPAEADSMQEAGLVLARRALAEARHIISGVRPPILDESGLLAAVSHLICEHATGPKIDFHSDVQFDRLAPIFENAVYRIVQESLTNVRLHSRSDRARVELVQRQNRLNITIEDWGVGFLPDEVEEGHYGLEGIRERARLLGGQAVINSLPGHGTVVIVELPLIYRRED